MFGHAHRSADVHRDWRHQMPLELEEQAVVRPLTWVILKEQNAFSNTGPACLGLFLPVDCSGYQSSPIRSVRFH